MMRPHVFLFSPLWTYQITPISNAVTYPPALFQSTSSDPKKQYASNENDLPRHTSSKGWRLHSQGRENCLTFDLFGTDSKAQKYFIQTTSSLFKHPSLPAFFRNSASPNSLSPSISLLSIFSCADKSIFLYPISGK